MDKADLIWRRATAGVLLVLCVAQLSAPGIFVDSPFFLDLFVTLDVFWRASVGDAPHVDVSTPVGQIYFWPFWIVSWVLSPSTWAMLQVSLLVALAISVGGWLALRDRLSGFALFLLVLLIFTTAISPREIGKGFTVFSHLAPYNRWSWGLIILTCVLIFVPKSQSDEDRGNWRDAHIVGVLIAIMALLKLTYALVGVGLVGASVLLGVRSFQFGFRVLPALFLAGGATLLLFGNGLAYFSDIQLAAGANKETQTGFVRIWKLRSHLIEGSVYGVLYCLALWLTVGTPRPLEFVKRYWRDIAAAAIIILAAAMLAVQNHPWNEGPLYLAPFILLFARRDIETLKAGWVARAGFVLVCLAVGRTVLLDGGAVMAHSVMARQAAPLEAFAKTPFEDLRLPIPAAEGQVVSAEDFRWRPAFKANDPRLSYYLMTTLEGLALTQRHLNAGETVFAADFANPFPALAGAPSVKGSLLWWDGGRSFSLNHHPEPDELLSNVTVVLVPKASHNMFITEMILKIYTPYLEAAFDKIEDAPHWTVWRRRQA